MRAEKQPGKQRYGSWSVMTEPVGQGTNFINVYAIRSRGTFEAEDAKIEIQYGVDDKGNVGPHASFRRMPRDIHEEAMASRRASKLRR